MGTIPTTFNGYSRRLQPERRNSVCSAIFYASCSNLLGIEGVTHKLTQGVVKRIIPAIASTNAIIAASCANEAYKIATNSSSCLDNWMMYNGGDAVYTSTTSYQRNDECLVCGAKGATVELTTTATLQDFLGTS